MGLQRVKLIKIIKSSRNSTHAHAQICGYITSSGSPYRHVNMPMQMKL
jgi:hypothetical protein